MKILFKKIKKCPILMKLFYFIGLIIYIVTYVFFFRSMLYLEGIETILRIILLILFGLFWFIYLIFGLTSMIQRKKKSFIFLTILLYLLSVAFGFSSYYINRFYKVLENFTQKDTTTYTTVLLTLKDTAISKDSTFGMISNEDNRENYVLAKEMITKEKYTQEITYYDDLNVLAAALYSGEVDAIFISKDYPILLGNEDKYKNISTDTIVVNTYSKEMKTEESEIVTLKNLTEPFSVLVLGVDSEDTEELDPNAAFNGDTLMLVTFNPKTLNATMFSIPRDMYVPISCNGNRYSKVNAAAYGGTSCVIKTIENMTDISIDYFVKVDFKAVVDLVDAMGGIDVFVEAPDYQYYVNSYGGRLCEQDSLRRFEEYLICMDTGMQHLNGEQALAYARNRHGYLESDIARNKHQQLVLEAMAKKLVQTSSFSDFENILTTISKHIATNMKTTQILSFYQTIKNMLGSALSGGEFINIQKTYLTYYNLEVMQGGYQVSALGYYPDSLKAIVKLMKENLEEIPLEDIKTFSYDYTKDHERTSDVIGKGIYSGKTLKFMKNFVGNSVSNAKSFANANDLSLNIEYISDPNEIAGIILKQSVASGVNLDTISGFTIYVNNPETIKEEEEKENTTNKNNNSSSNNKENNNSSSNNNSEKEIIDNNKDTDNSNNVENIPGTPSDKDSSTSVEKNDDDE